ncbi:unnamed protein product [Oikopleura dioica]|uniref:Large ribosomal subunit protein eL20 n=1 Tax=Oikopleura dioica TaxID=34765 RepID=E4XNK2_OIKDI|nr:unnamed protein product [Oikopleura dioica]
MKAKGDLREFIITGRKLPSDAQPHPSVYRVRLFAPDPIAAKSRFWYFVSYYKKVNKTAGEIISVKKVAEKTPGLVKNFGIWVRYDSRSGTHNMYREYRDTKTDGAVTQCYRDMGARHRARPGSIQILRVSTIGQLHPEHRRALERNKNRNDNRNNRHNQQRRRDPYANLMSRREREWITSMQLRALEIKNPETEDYYYVNYMKRLMQKGNAKNQRELILPAPKENNRNRKRNDSEKESKKEGDEDKEKEKKERKPWSEGSLGKPVSSSG